MKFNEQNTVENYIRDLLVKMGWYYIPKEQLNRQESDALVEEYLHQARQIFIQNVFDNQLSILANGETFYLKDSEVIPYEQRINVQIVYRDDKAIEKIKKRVEECSLYLDQK